MNLARSDDNGPYLQKGCPKRLYYVQDSSCVTAHCENGTYYINKSSGTKYQKIYVDCKEEYELYKIYRQNKQNKVFIQMFQLLAQLIRKIFCRAILCLTNGTMVREKMKKGMLWWAGMEMQNTPTHPPTIDRILS